jgi:alanine racemase
MSDRAEFLIDLSALSTNVSRLKKECAVDVLAVVKADAYGHGLVRVAQAAIKAGASYLGVALLEEALTLRENAVEAPILAWLVSPGSDFDSAISKNIELGVSSLKGLREISESAKRVGKKALIHIEVDTGMTRGGFLDEWKELLTEDFSQVQVIGVFSHFARADEPGEKQNADQLQKFKQMVGELEKIGISPLIKHLSNSAATLKDKDSYFSMVRVGIAMYGLTPDIIHMGTSKDLGLRPVGTVASETTFSKRGFKRFTSWIRCKCSHNIRYQVRCSSDGIRRWNSSHCTRCRSFCEGKESTNHWARFYGPICRRP